jgi:fibronectin-binding autotransporter adhesin
MVILWCDAYFGKPPVGYTAAIRRRGLAASASLVFAGLCWAATPTANAANFTCSWNDGTANWSTAADWLNCNGTIPNNGGGDTYDAAIPSGTPQLSTAITIGNATVSTPAGWQLNGSSAAATLTGSLTNSGSVQLAPNFADGGSSLTIGGTLTNNSGATVQVGTFSNNLGATTTLQAANLTNNGTVDLLGNTTAGSTNQAHMVIAGAAPSTLSGIYNLSGNALLEFGSGAITSIGAGAQLNEFGNSRVATTGNTATNSALATLSSSAGQLRLENGATVTTNSGANFANNNGGLIQLDDGFAQGGSSLTIGGTLFNNSGATVQVGTFSNNLGANSTLSAEGSATAARSI